MNFYGGTHQKNVYMVQERVLVTVCLLYYNILV